jgi:hypothetical protein
MQDTNSERDVNEQLPKDWWNVLISATHDGHARVNINYVLSGCVRKISISSETLHFNFIIVFKVFLILFQNWLLMHTYSCI